MGQVAPGMSGESVPVAWLEALGVPGELAAWPGTAGALVVGIGEVQE